MKKSILLILLLLLVLTALTLTACGEEDRSQLPGDTATSDTDSPAANDSDSYLGAFTTADLDGNEVTESVIGEADLTMVNIWGTFCGPCIKEMPDLGALNGEYADRGFQIIGIVCDVTDYQTGEILPAMVEEAKTIVADTGAAYLHLLPSKELNEAKLDDVIYIPETFFLDKHGKIVGEPEIGSHSKKEWAEIIEAKLMEVGK